MAKRSQFYSVVSDAEGNSLDEITVTVYEIGTETEANIYSTRSGGSPSPNSFETDTDGVVSFWADPGAYEVEFSDATLPTRISTFSIFWDAISGDANGIDGAQIERDGITGGTSGEIDEDTITPDNIADPTLQYGLGSGTGIVGADTTIISASIEIDETGWYDVYYSTVYSRSDSFTGICSYNSQVFVGFTEITDVCSNTSSKASTETKLITNSGRHPAAYLTAGNILNLVVWGIASGSVPADKTTLWARRIA